MNVEMPVEDVQPVPPVTETTLGRPVSDDGVRQATPFAKLRSQAPNKSLSERYWSAFDYSQAILPPCFGSALPCILTRRTLIYSSKISS